MEKWINVSRKKLRKSNQPLPSAIKTIFINHLPLDTRTSDLGGLFGKYGRISNIMLPISPKPSTKFRYAFIRFCESISQKMAISEMHGINFEGRRLIVQPAKSETNPKPSNHLLSPRDRNFKIHRTQPPTPFSRPNQNHSFRDHRTYKEVSAPKTLPQPSINPITNTSEPPQNPSHIPTTKTQSFVDPISSPFRIEEPWPDFFAKNPSTARLASSKALGEATVKARNDIITDEVDEEFTMIIKGSKNQDLHDVFERSVVATAISSQRSSEILNNILAEGINCLTIKPMGGLHLIQ